MMCTNWEQRKAMLEKNGWVRSGYCYVKETKTEYFLTCTTKILQRMTDSEFLDTLDGMLHR